MSLASRRQDSIFNQIHLERNRQDQLKLAGKFLWTCADVKYPNVNKLSILAEEFGEVAKEVTDQVIWKEKHKGKVNQFIADQRQKLRTELIQVAAVCVGWIEALDEESAHGE